jgi:hypothetical protein
MSGIERGLFLGENLSRVRIHFPCRECGVSDQLPVRADATAFSACSNRRWYVEAGRHRVPTGQIRKARVGCHTSTQTWTRGLGCRQQPVPRAKRPRHQEQFLSVLQSLLVRNHPRQQYSSFTRVRSSFITAFFINPQVQYNGLDNRFICTWEPKLHCLNTCHF